MIEEVPGMVVYYKIRLGVNEEDNMDSRSQEIGLGRYCPSV